MTRYHNKAEGQRRRGQTPEGKAHMEKMRAAAEAANRARRVIPDHLKGWNQKMRRQGISQAERFAAIRAAAQRVGQ